MIKSYSISIYPDKDMDMNRIKRYIQQAAHYSCRDVFTSAHMPEKSFEEQLTGIVDIATAVHKNEMMLTVDFGGRSLLEALRNKKYQNLIQQAEIDYIRLDYGYDATIMKKVYEILGIRGFVWNASIMQECELLKYVSICDQYTDMRIEACHNFYPRPETGLDITFMRNQYDLFHSRGIRVTGCLASMTHARPPINAGLPTAEVHRNMPLQEAALELDRTRTADSILMGDEFISEKELQQLHDIVRRQPLLLHCSFHPDITAIEKKLLLKVHTIRYDSNSWILRSQTSREMAELAHELPAHNTMERRTLSITIDNERYLRYSGEIQFVLKDLPADERVNVIGWINNEDAWKLRYAKSGYSYLLIVI